jgi:hypothetical protein
VSRSSADARRADLLLQLAWVAVGVYLLALGIAAVLRTQGDFNLYYRAGARVLHGESIYRLDESSHFLYAPIIAIAFAPFAALPLRGAQFAFFLVCAVSLIALIFGSRRMLLDRERRLTPVLILLPVILCARFIDNNIEHGQINLPTLALTVWAIIFGEEDLPIASGAALALAVLIKPFAGLAGLFLLLEGKWRPIIFSIGFGFALVIAPMLFFGPRGAIEQTIAYVQVVDSMTDRYTTMLTNQSATSAVARLMSIGAGANSSSSHAALYIGTAIELALVGAIVIWFLRTVDSGPRNGLPPHRFELAAFFCIMPSLVPISWKSYYAALLVPYLLLTYVLWVERPPGSPNPTLALALVAASVVLNWIPGTRPNHVALFFSAHFLSSMLLLAALAVTARWWQESLDCRHTPSRTVNS